MSEVMMWFERGGILMYPLLLSSIVAVWIFLERLYHLKRAGGKADAIYDAVKVLVLEGKRQAAIDRAREHPGPVAAVFRAVLDTSFTERSELEEVALIQGKKELQRLSRRLPLLSLIVGIAPLLGLLGTVLGLVKAFQKVAATQGTVNPSLLAGGIWEALLTTVVGLVIAIPAALLHYYLDQKVKEYVFQMNHYGALLIQLLVTTETEDGHARHRLRSP
ncbi:MAG TPA: MotA/TolQ/ExbB proton channel family protein [Alphaproteobacteria bacterium]|nr:MotA/TolQ/ExbB proton channel family protein [Alphaproteobacteria bacterium]